MATQETMPPEVQKLILGMIGGVNTALWQVDFTQPAQAGFFTSGERE